MFVGGFFGFVLDNTIPGKCVSRDSPTCRTHKTGMFVGGFFGFVLDNTIPGKCVGRDSLIHVGPIRPVSL